MSKYKCVREINKTMYNLKLVFKSRKYVKSLREYQSVKFLNYNASSIKKYKPKCIYISCILRCNYVVIKCY